MEIEISDLEGIILAGLSLHNEVGSGEFSNASSFDNNDDMSVFTNKMNLWDEE